MSATLDRCPVRDLSASLPTNGADALSPRRTDQVTNIVTINAMPVAVTLMLVWLVTIGIVVFGDGISLKLIALVYLFPVVGVAALWGLVPALVAAVAGAAAADFFFPPSGSFWYMNPRPAADLALLLFVGIIASNLAARLRNDGHTAGSAKLIAEPGAFVQDFASGDLAPGK